MCCLCDVNLLWIQEVTLYFYELSAVAAARGVGVGGWHLRCVDLSSFTRQSRKKEKKSDNSSWLWVVFKKSKVLLLYFINHFIDFYSCLVTACQRHGSWHSNGQLFSPPLFECLGNNWIKFGTGHATFRMDCNNLKLKYSRMAVNQSCFPHDCLCRLWFRDSNSLQ